MNLRAGLSAAAHHGMRAYYVPFAAGLLLVLSAFLPRILVDNLPLGRVPDLAGLWIFGLGLLAAVLASLSIITRKNSRHPLLVVGLAAFAILFLAAKRMERLASEQAWAVSQARAIVDEVSAPVPSVASLGAGAYVGLTASGVLVLFGMTIVLKQISQPFVEPEDDDA